jgi:hypothetical protein
MTVRAGHHRLTGMVSLGRFHDDMKKFESGKFIKNLKNSYAGSTHDFYDGLQGKSVCYQH